MGTEYLIYAHSSDMYGDKGDLVTIICDRTTELKDAAEDLALLGEETPPEESVNLEGEVKQRGSLVTQIIFGAVFLIGAAWMVIWKQMKKDGS